MIKYSIIVPVYNDVEYIEKAIQSVLNQSFKDFELILVDDFSRDNSGKICDEYKERDNRIIVIHNKCNMGSLYSRDVGIKKASGEYLAFMDGDDYINNDLLEKVNNIIEKSDVDLVMFGYNTIKENEVINNNSSKSTLLFGKNNRNEFIMKYALDSKCNALWNKVVRASLINGLIVPESDFSIMRGTDQYLSIDIYKKVTSIIIIPDILYNYRINNNGITMRQKKNYNLDFRNRIKLKNMIYEETCLSNKDIEKFEKYSYNKFRSQIARIANLDTNTNTKIEIFDRIKNESYYIDYIITLINKYGIDYQLKPFIEGEYKKLIFLMKIKYAILNTIKR